MSTKSTIFLTNDNEHCYKETSEPNYDGNNNFIGFTIIMEFDKKNNINILEDCFSDLIIEIKPGSEIYNIIKSIKK